MQIRSEDEGRGPHSANLPHLSSLPTSMVLRAGCRHEEAAVTMAVLRSVRGSPNLPQWPVGAVDRIVIGNGQGNDSVIGPWPFPG